MSPNKLAACGTNEKDNYAILKAKRAPFFIYLLHGMSKAFPKLKLTWEKIQKSTIFLNPSLVDI